MNSLLKIASGILLFFIFLLIIFFGIGIFRNDFIRAIDPNGLNFIYPSVSIKDSNGNRYIIDNSSKRILKIDEGNNLQYIIFGGKKSGNTFYNAVNIAVDYGENLYVVNQVFDEYGFYTIREEIVRYNRDGRFDKVIFQKNRTEKDVTPQDVQRSSFTSIYHINDVVIWYETTKDGVFTYTFNTGTERITFKQVMKFKDANIYISSVAYYGEDSFIYTNKVGEIYLYSQKEGEKLIYKNINVLPFDLVKSNRGNIYFTDILNKTIMKVGDKGEVANLISREQPNKYGVLINDVYYKLSVGNDEDLLINNDVFVIELKSNGEIQYIENSAAIPSKFFIIVGLYYLALLLAAVFFIFLSRFFYIYVLKRRVSMIIKQVLIYVPIIIISIILTSFVIFTDLTKRYEELLNNQIASMLQTISLSIDGDDFNNIKSQLDFMNDSYKNLKESIMRLLDYNMDPWNSGFYFTLHKKFDDDNIYTIMFLNDSVTAKYPFNYLNEPDSIYTQAIKGEILIEKSVDAWGNWFYGVAPVFDSKGNIAGLLEIGKDNVAFETANKKLLWKIIRNIVIIAIVMIIVLCIVSYYMLRALRDLKEGASKISKGQHDISIPTKGNDELADVTISFNNMAKSVNSFINDITSLNRAYHKFVPEEFLKFLNKESIMEVELGDQIEKEMTIMFSDIVGFTSISEQLTPEENFNFLNSYLSLVGPSVRENSGFIDKYIGDSIMALYPNGPDDALRTATEILALLNNFNKKLAAKGYQPIGVGFGIHTGTLMLGILGEKQRVDSTVISDNVNLTSRLEGLTRKFGASIIISETTYDKLHQRELYVFRNLGLVRVKGKGNNVRIYEVLDGLGSSLKKERIKYLEFFEKGIEAYEKLDFVRSYSLFSAILKKCPSDVVALEFYMNMCKKALKEKLSEGVLILTDK